MGSSVQFSWDIEEFEALVDCCHRDDGVQLGLKHLPKDDLILEAGCGTGRVVKFLQDLGYSIEGIEVNAEIIRQVKQVHPDLNLIAGDILSIPKEDNYYGGIISFGVVEHFPQGLELPLAEHYRLLKPGGIAVITVPSFNTIRKIKYFFGKNFIDLNPKRNNLIRSWLKKDKLVRNQNGFKFYVHPQFGNFFEYRLTPEEFEYQCLQVGFKIIESVSISHIDGLFAEFGQKLCRFENWKFYPTPIGTFLNNTFRKIPFFHNHMHACVLTK